VGVGGGFLMVPLQVLWAGTSQVRANATSLAAVVPISITGSLVYALSRPRPEIDFRLALLLALGAVPGVYLGARLLSRIPERPLRLGVAVVLAAVGVKEVLLP
jgi:uncharacterized membrane protein YfcA